MIAYHRSKITTIQKKKIFFVNAACFYLTLIDGIFFNLFVELFLFECCNLN